MFSGQDKARMQPKDFRSVAPKHRQILLMNVKCCYRYIWILCLYEHICFVWI